eukprot:CAMPEP_0118671446 /NCGR_PEP_ID=MMETSP0785-20121206/22005_1 /TAXON_ID=91992 /ORGANISM="Bolidomonas pacifica, Strain CCMP 1866" /LENGTH=111 /DNA_ID=CAMNT_0006566329 /DNA_START=24 /DNA_END=359 /DNA_ORIENTATION=+
MNAIGTRNEILDEDRRSKPPSVSRIERHKNLESMRGILRFTVALSCILSLDLPLDASSVARHLLNQLSPTAAGVRRTVMTHLKPNPLLADGLDKLITSLPAPTLDDGAARE